MPVPNSWIINAQVGVATWPCTHTVVDLIVADREDMADKDAKAVAMLTDHADVPRGGVPEIVSAQATSSAAQQDVAVISDRPDDTCAVVGRTVQGASLLPTPTSQLHASHGNKHQQRPSGASGEAAVAPVLRGGDGHVSCEMDEGCGHRSQCEGIGPRSWGLEPAGGDIRLGSEASAEVCGAPSPPDSAERREPGDGGPAARVRKGAWRRRGTRCRTGPLAESQAGLTQAAPFDGVAQPAEGLGAAVVRGVHPSHLRARRACCAGPAAAVAMVSEGVPDLDSEQLQGSSAAVSGVACIKTLAALEGDPAENLHARPHLACRCPVIVYF